MNLPYRVVVADNFHYQDEDEHSNGGNFATADEAVSRCKQIVDEWLVGNRKPGMTADELYDGYVTFGEDPFITSSTGAVDFSAWDYAKMRAAELCRDGKVTA